MKTPSMLTRHTCAFLFGLASLSAACASRPLPNTADASLVEPVRFDAGEAELGQGEAGPRDSAKLPPGTQLLEGVLIDDFEDGDSKTVYPKGGWYSYDDKSNGGASTITFTGSVGPPVMNGPGFQSNRSLEVTFTFDQGTLTYPPYVGWGAWFADKAAPLDVSKFLGVGYTYRGSAHRVRFETFEVTDYDFAGMQVAASTDWKTVVVPFSQLTQEGFGAKVAFNPKNLGIVSFQARGATGTKGQLDIDNLMFLTRLPDQVPDMSVTPAQPPADEVIPSIAIAHPAQARARAYLNRGYNITNWLEEKRFDGFTYDEAFVTKLAAAGFKSLRLPVDLDRYIVSNSGSGAIMDGGAYVDGGAAADGGVGVDGGADADVVVHEDLFKVLDAFVLWTAKAGISLTIDYHQYDGSLKMSDPGSISRAVAVWGKVAAHFASNPREDLFFELLNEPDLSFSGTPPTQSQWTAIAERMIAAIRASDTTHTILFGDVSWYGIDTLSKRKPLSDGNVIYVIHTYDPFIFTHQGADWASMASTHDLPYPYSADRWSQYYGDLGFNTSMPEWILQSAKNYFATGNRSAIRNHIVTAKRWAVANNVPVTCNEFGVYDRAARLEDRARYLTDVISIFEELEIPWQQWFMVMDAAGTVVPEYRAAMRLGL